MTAYERRRKEVEEEARNAEEDLEDHYRRLSEDLFGTGDLVKEDVQVRDEVDFH